MILNDLINDASQESIGEIRVEAGLHGQLPHPFELLSFSLFIHGAQLLCFFELPNFICKTESVSEQTHQFFVNSINPFPKSSQTGSRVHIRRYVGPRIRQRPNDHTTNELSVVWLVKQGLKFLCSGRFLGGNYAQFLTQVNPRVLA